ncbi:hypothetical protein BTA51_04240 [Hahella sp. CCB-MM4]|uniref:substrate-binding periplasmic protein n=1 Tax=Hahella sp. (strain CCB-MM4) TaxID=1926491 RepID=UPI000B9BFBEA|nr:transporter substrate-binding domain-containing protein [Hahella sp. CCB-MM4]OZG74233.1 hypothetical protein BTA51_04240 [Hahella sp. CCB-MM4]
MKKITCTFIAILWMLFSGASTAASFCSQLNVTGNPEYPPLLWHDRRNPDKLIGAAVELLEMAVADEGIKVNSLYVGPWSRSQAEARVGRIDMLTGAFITDERQTWMDYVMPPMMYMPNVIFVKKGHEFELETWANLKGHLGDTLINNSFGQEFDLYSKRNLVIEEVRSIEFAFERLMLGRTDYVIYELYQGIAIAEAMGVGEDIVALDEPISSEGLYFTLSKASKCNSPEFRSFLDNKISELVESNVPQNLVKKYTNIWKEQAALPRVD